MQFTISLLPVSLTLVHIPRRNLGPCIQPLLRQILLDHIFFNLTSNDVELSLFTEQQDDFLQALGQPLPDGIEVDERWSVLQIDTHAHSDNQLDDSAARVHDLSFPLASAGISILYQASYSSDFIFVQESRLDDALSLLGEAGFDLYTEDADHLVSHTQSMASPPLSPISDGRRPSFDSIQSPLPSAVLTRTRSSTNTSLGSSMSQSDRPRDLQDLPEPKTSSRANSPVTGKVELLPGSLACVGLSDGDSELWTLKIFKLIAFPDLIPGGLSKDRETHERRLPPTPPPTDIQPEAQETCDTPTEEVAVPTIVTEPETESHQPFFSFTKSPDGSSLTTVVSALASLFPLSERHMVKNGGELDVEDARRLRGDDFMDEEDDATLKCLQIDLQKFGLDKYGLVNRFSRVLGDHHINHLYSSTYKTANLLVDKRHAKYAQDLLQDC